MRELLDSLVADGREFGGSEAYADPTCGFSFAFTHSRLTLVDSAPEVAARIRKELGI